MGWGDLAVRHVFAGKVRHPAWTAPPPWERGHLARIADRAGGASTPWAGKMPALPGRAAFSSPVVRAPRRAGRLSRWREGSFHTRSDDELPLSGLGIMHGGTGLRAYSAPPNFTGTAQARGRRPGRGSRRPDRGRRGRGGGRPIGRVSGRWRSPAELWFSWSPPAIRYGQRGEPPSRRRRVPSLFIAR